MVSDCMVKPDPKLDTKNLGIDTIRHNQKTKKQPNSFSEVGGCFFLNLPSSIFKHL